MSDHITHDPFYRPRSNQNPIEDTNFCRHFLGPVDDLFPSGFGFDLDYLREIRMFDFIQNIDPNTFEVAGVVGFGLYVTNYTLLTFHRLHSHDALYFGINLVAATLVLASLTTSFNLASAMIQAFWVVISITAIILRLYRKSKAKKGSHDLVAEVAHVYDEAKTSDMRPAAAG